MLLGAFPFSANAKGLCSFKGNVDFAENQFNIKFDCEDKATINAQLSSEAKDELYFKAKIEHLKLSFLDISTVLESVIKLVKEEKGPGRYYQGDVRSQYSLIDYKPVPELSGNYEIRNGRLFLRSLRWGGVQCQGYLGLLPPHDLDLTVQVEDIRSNDFFKLIGLPEEELNISGYIEGVFADLEYDNIILNFEVVYPFILITDSVIAQTNGLIFQMEGAVSLIQKDAKTVQEELARLKMSPIVDESMERREWTIKRKSKEGSSSMTEFKYRMQKSGYLNRPFEEQPDILGIERSIQF